MAFDFVPQFSSTQFKYVFSSEEYSDFSNTTFNDVFGFFINGQNCALVPGTSEPVSVNTVNNGNDVGGGDTTPHHPELFRDNVNPSPTIDTEMDGLTLVFTCTATVNAGQTNHIKLAIADASDGDLDSAVFIQAGSLVSIPCGNGMCEPDKGETCVNCPADCGSCCGNGICDSGENPTNCPADCVPPCGNGTCDAGETCTNCPADCGLCFCGNGTCDPAETCTKCPADCGACQATTTTTTTTSTSTSTTTTTTTIPENKCPRSQGFWKNHPAAWPVTALTLGSQTYTQAELLTILSTAVGSGLKADASLILADQLIAAKLNIANGSDPSPVSGTIADADSLLATFSGKLPYKVSATSTTGKAMIHDANVLDSYNNGTLTPNCVP